MKIRSESHSYPQQVKTSHTVARAAMEPPGKLTLFRLLGAGSYGFVYEGLRAADAPAGDVDAGAAARVAVKIMLASDAPRPDGSAPPRVPTSIMRELRFLRSDAARHPHIVRLLDVVPDPATQTTSLVLELADTDLARVLAAPGRWTGVTDDWAVRVFRELVGAVAHMHAAGFVHR